MSTLSIHIAPDVRAGRAPRTIEVPCRLPEAFNFVSASKQYTAVLKGSGEGLALEQVDWTGGEPEEAAFDRAAARAESILATIKATLGITGPVPPNSPLQSIALAYEAECAAYDARAKALESMPCNMNGLGLLGTHPDEDTATGVHSLAARMLAKYVEYVVEQAAKEVK